MGRKASLVDPSEKWPSPGSPVPRPHGQPCGPVSWENPKPVYAEMLFAASSSGPLERALQTRRKAEWCAERPAVVLTSHSISGSHRCKRRLVLPALSPA